MTTTSAVRLMVPVALERDDHAMDEATLDCQICGRPALVEVLDQTLSDAAEWRTHYRMLLCRDHYDRVDIDAVRLSEAQRVIVQRCG